MTYYAWKDGEFRTAFVGTQDEFAAFLARRGFVAGDAPPPPAPLTPAEIEAEVQAIAEQITAGDDRDVAMAMATVDLVMAAVNGNLAGLTKAQVRQAFRDRIVDNLRTRRGI